MVSVQMWKTQPTLSADVKLSVKIEKSFRKITHKYENIFEFLKNRRNSEKFKERNQLRKV